MGVPLHYTLPITSNNITTIGFVDHAILPDFYSEAEFYLQLSISEGFPNALSEAMLCECIPIGSSVGAIPDIIGDAGFVLKKRDIEALKHVIEEALASHREDLSIKARNRIKDLYPEILRKQRLLRLADDLIKQKPS
jgi:glycosyltransferase involved in cell wall biosynthesis